MAKNGQMRGLNKKEATTDQSRVSAPNPSPLKPEPSCWAVIDLGKAQQTHEILCRDWKKKSGTEYQRKLPVIAMTKNFDLDMRFLLSPSVLSPFSFSCSVLQIQYTKLQTMFF